MDNITYHVILVCCLQNCPLSYRIQKPHPAFLGSKLSSELPSRKSPPYLFRVQYRYPNLHTYSSLRRWGTCDVVIRDMNFSLLSLFFTFIKTTTIFRDSSRPCGLRVKNNSPNYYVWGLCLFYLLRGKEWGRESFSTLNVLDFEGKSSQWILSLFEPLNICYLGLSIFLLQTDLYVVLNTCPYFRVNPKQR